MNRPSFEFVVKVRFIGGKIGYLPYSTDQLCKARRNAEHRQDVDVVLWTRLKSELNLTQNKP